MTKHASLQEAIDVALNNLLSAHPPHSKKLKDALAYSLLAKSKKLRARLVLLCGESLNLGFEKLLPAACAIESIHSYSLVHDDLPAMDDDDFRRGQPSAHKAFDEATAILVGDALQTLANLSILKADCLTASEKIAQLTCLNQASGQQGMIDGQMLDLFPEGSEISHIITRHRLKTGALISASVMMSVALATIDNASRTRYLDFGHHLGLAFQMHDDYLDVYGQEETLGKPPGSDKDSDKKTFATFYTKEALYEAVQASYQKASEALLPLEPQTSPLLALCQEMKERL
jgi:farnesyl diphosphate synthase